ncbi:pectinesterase-like [Salvia miltiorrhiza]|uniref:pectinesterase-like n=1 Tax=Salvia miltiorrhiza TaxID=226208 RepID=UPI0025AC01C5|nr:pectinesterase-like [Salvia miltiorrhiza]
MNEATDALDHIKQQQPKSSNARERAALSDCSQFYDLSITHLNQSLDPDLDSTPFDVQIWLSAALTNLDNCKTTMSEQNVTHPLFLNNKASQLISSGLAINAQLIKDSREDLLSWFPDEDVLSLPDLARDDTIIVVAQDGSGEFRSIKEALDAYHTRKGNGRFVIHVKQGTYRENVEINREMSNVMLAGDGIGKSIITGDRSARSGFSTRESATVKVMGDGFVARDMTFRNTAGPDGGQAVALLSSSDRSAYYRCAFEGYQDTLWVDVNRQFYQECLIYGTIDFIFGNAAAVIQNSVIYGRAPRRGQSVVITAQGRTERNQPTGLSIINCRFKADPEQKQAVRGLKAYLGRPWRDYARVVYMRSYLDGMVDPVGWMDWGQKSETVYYAEYGNYGPGSPTKMRVRWSGFRVIKDIREAQKFCVANFIAGLKWLPHTGVPFSAGL